MNPGISWWTRMTWSAFYNLLVVPTGWAVRYLWDPLRIKNRPQNWILRPSGRMDMRSARKRW